MIVIIHKEFQYLHFILLKKSQAETFLSLKKERQWGIFMLYANIVLGDVFIVELSSFFKRNFFLQTFFSLLKLDALLWKHNPPELWHIWIHTRRKKK